MSFIVVWSHQEHNDILQKRKFQQKIVFDFKSVIALLDLR